MFDTYEEIFAARAASYQAAMERWPAVRRGEFTAALSPLALAPGMLLADVPAGGGYLAGYLGEGVRYVGVEPSDHFLAACPESPLAARRKGSADATGLDAATLDALASVAGLHHCPDLDAVFAEFRRVIGPQGTVVILEVEAGTPTADFLNGFVHAHNSMGHEGHFFDGATAGRLERAGFTVAGDDLLVIPWAFDAEADIGCFARALFGIDRAGEAEVSDAMRQTLGLCAGPGAVNIAWPLRRLVARPRA